MSQLDVAEVEGLATLQFAYGGLFDAVPTDYVVHLVREFPLAAEGRKDSDTLCGIDRFAEDGPGWALGGGVDGPGMVHAPCDGCVSAARSAYPGLPIRGMRALVDPVRHAIAAAAHAEAETTVWRMWAHDRTHALTDIGSRLYVQAHQLPYPIVPVDVRLVADDDPAATHWGWIQAGKDKPSMIWHRRVLYDVRFAYDPKAEEEAGRGRTVRLTVHPCEEEVPDGHA